MRPPPPFWNPGPPAVLGSVLPGGSCGEGLCELGLVGRSVASAAEVQRAMQRMIIRRSYVVYALTGFTQRRWGQQVTGDG